MCRRFKMTQTVPQSGTSPRSGENVSLELAPVSRIQASGRDSSTSLASILLKKDVMQTQPKFRTACDLLYEYKSYCKTNVKGR